MVHCYSKGSRFLSSRVFLSFIFLFLLSKPKIAAQDSDVDFALINIGVSFIIGGAAAIINKEPEEKLGKVLLKGFAQGALGGYVVFENKRMLREFSKTRNFEYV